MVTIRRRLRNATTVAVLLSMLTAACSSASHRTTTAAAPRRRAEVAPPTTLAPTDIVNVDMLSPSVGVGVGSTTVDKEHFVDGAVYLAVTDDGGQHWQVSGTVVPNEGGLAWETSLSFISPSVGYVTPSAGPSGPDETFFTADAGRTWTAVPTAGGVGDDSVNGGQLWTIKPHCLGDDVFSCTNDLVTYQAGSTAVASDHPIPFEGIQLPAGGPEQPELLARLGPTSGVIGEGGEGGPTSLLVTGDSGATWHLSPNPCGGLDLAGLVTVGATWKLYCNLDGGMHQGHVKLFTSTDNGQLWALTAAGVIEGPGDLGNIGDGIDGDLTRSGDGNRLWLESSVNGVQGSSDGGRDWTDTGVTTDGQANAIDTVGERDAWIPVPGIGLYRTTDGSTWVKL